MRKYKDNSNSHRNTKNSLQGSDIEEMENTGLYKVHPGLPPGRHSFALPPGCQQGSVPGELIPRQDIPRSMANSFDSLSLTAYTFSMFNNQSDNEVQEQNLPPGYYDQRNLQQQPRLTYQGSVDVKKTTNNQGPNRKGVTPTKQYPQGVQNHPVAAYRQFDRNQTIEDAETDEEAFQDPDMDEYDCRQN